MRLGEEPRVLSDAHTLSLPAPVYWARVDPSLGVLGASGRCPLMSSQHQARRTDARSASALPPSRSLTQEHKPGS